MIVGGGLAGAAAAIATAASRRVVLIERDAGPKLKVCGEFLSPEAQLYLGRLGIDLEALGAVAIRQLRFISDGRTSELPLPFTGQSLSRQVLDEALLAKAAASGVTVRRNARVVGISGGRGAWAARLDRGATVTGTDLMLATGKHDLRGLGRPAGLHRDLVGFKQHYRLSAAAGAVLAGTVELHLFDGGYAGLEPIERGGANLCLVVDRAVLAAAGRDWAGLLEMLRRTLPDLAARLAGAVPLSAYPAAVSAIPYGHVQWRSDGIWRLGDQAAVIPSFTGDGMAMALHSAALASRMLAEGGSARDYQRRLARDVLRPVALATVFSRALVKSAPRRILGTIARRVPLLVSSLARLTRLPSGRLVQVPVWPLPRSRTMSPARMPSGAISGWSWSRA